MKALNQYGSTDLWQNAPDWEASRREMGIAAAQDYLAAKQHPLNDFHSRTPRWVYRATWLLCLFLMLALAVAFATHVHARVQIEAVHIDCRPTPKC